MRTTSGTWNFWAIFRIIGSVGADKSDFGRAFQEPKTELRGISHPFSWCEQRSKLEMNCITAAGLSGHECCQSQSQVQVSWPQSVSHVSQVSWPHVSWPHLVSHVAQVAAHVAQVARNVWGHPLHD